MTKATVIVIAAIHGLAPKSSTINLCPNPQDSLPPLHTLKEKDIAAVIPSFERHTITVALKNHVSYVYEEKDWDFEDRNPETCKKVLDAIKENEMTWTKVEQLPTFPGGEAAWNKYLLDFCSQHAKLIKKKGPADVTVQFVIHLKGQVVELHVLSDADHPVNPELAALAMQAIKDGPAWIPAFQNGRYVVYRHSQIVKLSL